MTVFFCGGVLFHFLTNQYRAMEGGLAARRFPKGIYDPLKNPWRDFSMASAAKKILNTHPCPVAAPYFHQGKLPVFRAGAVNDSLPASLVVRVRKGDGAQ